MNGVHLGRTMLGYNQFDTDVWIDPGRVDDVFSFVIGTGPPSIFTLDDAPINCSDNGGGRVAVETVAHPTPGRRRGLHDQGDGR